METLGLTDKDGSKSSDHYMGFNLNIFLHFDYVKERHSERQNYYPNVFLLKGKNRRRSNSDLRENKYLLCQSVLKLNTLSSQLNDKFASEDSLKSLQDTECVDNLLLPI